jgi:hypothetical protein
MIISSHKVDEYQKKHDRVKADGEAKWTLIHRLETEERLGICQFYRGDYVAAFETLSSTIAVSNSISSSFRSSTPSFEPETAIDEDEDEEAEEEKEKEKRRERAIWKPTRC